MVTTQDVTSAPSTSHDSDGVKPTSSSISRLRGARNSHALIDWLDAELTQASTSGSTLDAPPSPAGSKLDQASQALRQLSLQLSSVRESSRNEIEQIISSLVATIPNMGVELQLMSETAKTLESRLISLHDTGSRKGDGVDVALSKISVMSKAKAEMIAARHTLREAQAWSTLESEVNALVSDQRWEEAVGRLVKASESLQFFSGSVKSTQDRKTLLAELSRQIENELQPVLHEAILDREVASTVRLAKLFVQLDRVSEAFMPVYLSTRTQGLLSRWTRRATEQAAEQRSLSARLTSLFGDMMALLGEERVFSPKIFSNPRTAAALLLSYIFSSLDPTLDVVIGYAGQGVSTEVFLSSLTDAWKASEEAFKSFEDILPAASESAQQDFEAGQEAPIINLDLADSFSRPNWQELLLAPFLPYQTQFSDLEGEAMQLRYQASTQENRSQNLLALSTQAVEVAKAGLKRSAALTKSFATASLLPRIEDLLVSSADQCRAEEEQNSKQTLQSIRERITRSHIANGAGLTSLTFDERGEALAPSDWEQFRNATEKLSTCRQALTAISNLEQSVAYQLSELGASLSTPTSTNPPVKSVTPTSGLAASTLNSDSLHQSIAKSKRLLSSQAWDHDRTLLTSGRVTAAHEAERLLPLSRRAILSIGQSIQRFQHELVLAPFMPELESYASLSTWTSLTQPGLTNEYDLAMPKFSLSPTEAMARIGEGMLNLPRLFEGYAEEPLLFCLPSYEDAISQNESDDAAGPKKQQSMSETASRSTLHRQAFSTTSAVPTPIPTSTAEEDSEKDKDSMLSIYLHSVLTTFFKHLLQTTLPSLPRLTDIGSSQLSTDLEYLSNITSVIYPESDFILHLYRKSTEISTDTGLALVDFLRGQTSDLPAIPGFAPDRVRELAHSKAFATIARLRGWI